MKPLPDILEIQPLAKPPNCTITVPGSKSITNRALILAALSDGKCTLRGALWADDTQVMVDSLQKLGFEVTVEPDPVEECNRTILVVGRGGEIPAKKAELYVGNAGTAARFLTALVCLGHGEYAIRGDKRMHERPMKELFDALRYLGVRIEANDDHLPAIIHARGLHSGEITVSAERSSQFASALVLISRRCGPQGLAVKMSAIKTEYHDEDYYFVMTADMVGSGVFGDYLIEPDLSGASYFFAAGWIGQGRVTIVNDPPKSLQIDAQFPDYLPQLKGNHPLRVSRVLHLGDSVMTLAVCSLFGNTPFKLKVRQDYASKKQIESRRWWRSCGASGRRRKNTTMDSRFGPQNMANSMVPTSKRTMITAWRCVFPC